MSYYRCPTCSYSESVERIKLEKIDLFGLDYPKYREIRILKCASCNTEWPLQYYDILHEK